MDLNTKKVEVKPTSAAGRGLFASTDISAGDLIFSVHQPLISVLDNAHLDIACSNCFAWRSKNAAATLFEEDEALKLNLKVCTGCRVVKYCSKSCQAQSWKTGHKYECSLFSRLHPKILPSTVRAIIRPLLRHKKGEFSATQWQSLLQLESHLSDFQETGGERWDNICLMSQGAEMYSGTSLGSFGVRELFCRTLINSLTLVSPDFEPLGICLDPLPATMNHSCDPNAVIVFDGPLLAVRSLKQIPAGEEICISYIDCTDPISRRRSELVQRYFFNCSCHACLKGNPEELRNIIDLGPQYDGYELLDKAKKELDSIAAIKLLRTGLSGLKMSQSGSITRQPGPSLRQQLVIQYLAARQWVPALMQMLVIYFYIDPVLFPQPHYPIRVIHNWTLLKLLLNISHLMAEGSSMVHDLERFELNYGVVILGLGYEVVSNVGFSHGGDSRFSKMVHRKLDQLRIDMTRNTDGGSPFTRKERVDKEWTKLRSVADAALN